jgi:aminopeptidase-like protein
VNNKELSKYANRALLLAKKLFPINRSISNNGVKKSLRILAKDHEHFKIKSFKAQSKVYDWNITKRWNVKKAKVLNFEGKVLVDFKKNNLHIVSHSQPVKKKVKREELMKHLHTRPDLPDAIPYVTSYYKKEWGFCISENQRKTLKDDYYFVEIDSSFNSNPMSYGEIYIPGKLKREVFFSTYICHPAMANNELSGPVVAESIIKYLSHRENNYSYRFIFIPETIGSIAYIKKNLYQMQKNILGGFVLSCLGDERNFSIISSRTSNNPLEKILSKNIIKNEKKYSAKLKTYSFLERGSDERQFCSPGVNLPISGFCRSKYGTYPEYHTSLDNFNLVTENGFKGSIDVLIKTIKEIENLDFPTAKYLCEPNLGKRGLYPLLGARKKTPFVKNIKNVLAYADGKNSTKDIAEIIGVNESNIKSYVELLRDKDLIL